jgi:methionine-R-sulfoxide reductase
MHQLKTYLAKRQMKNGKPNSTTIPIMYYVKRVPKDLFLDCTTTIMSKVFTNVLGCDAPLYVSDYKYDSGSGWPAFDRAVEGAVSYRKDNKLGYTRIELICSSCGGHLGHMFNDGPRQTTGQRHCINSVALSFVSDDE